jgi:ATP-dependent RNA helicase DOB1
MCDVYEGSIIRCMRRLDELLKQLENAAKVIGNEVNQYLPFFNKINN